MIRAALKSLLDRKVRLLMSTTAIVLGVAFVVGTLIFSDTLNRSFTALFASTVGDVVVQPEGGGDVPGGGASTLTVPGSLVDVLADVPGAARADGQIGVPGVYVIDSGGKPIGGFGPPSFGSNWSDAPAGNGLKGLTIIEGRAPESPGEVVLDTSTADRSGYDVGDPVPMITSDETANLEPTLVGIADFADGGSHERRHPLVVHRRGVATPVPRRQGRLQHGVGHRRTASVRRSCATGWRRCCPAGSRRSPATSRQTSRPATSSRRSRSSPRSC